VRACARVAALVVLAQFAVIGPATATWSAYTLPKAIVSVTASPYYLCGNRCITVPAGTTVYFQFTNPGDTDRYFNGTTGNDTVNYWRWDFGDNDAHSFDQSTSHRYDSPGPHGASLTLDDSEFCGYDANLNPVFTYSGFLADDPASHGPPYDPEHPEDQSHPYEYTINVIKADIRDNNTNDVVTDETHDSCVGENHNYQGIVNMGTIDSYTWSIPNISYNNWTGDGTHSTLTPVDTSTNPVYCYWVDGGSKVVTFTASVCGFQLSAHTTVSVAAPTGVSVSIDHGSVGTPPGWAIQCGDPSNGASGVSFTPHWTDPSGYTGDVEWVQTISNYSRRRNHAGDWYHQQVSSNVSYLDNTYPYGFAEDSSTNPPTSLKPTTVDSPGTLDIFPDYERVNISDTFHMYLLYSASTSCHWVPLGKIDWSWGGESYFAAWKWNLVSGSAVNPIPNWQSVTDYPAWTDNITTVQNSSWGKE